LPVNPSANSGISRGVFEFDLSRFAPGTAVASARIGLDVTSVTTNGGNAPLVNFETYLGDGAGTPADGPAAGPVPGSASPLTTGYQEFTLNTSAVQSLLGGKITVRAEEPGTSAYTFSVAALELAGVPHATLILDLATTPTLGLSVSPHQFSEGAGAN